MPTPMLFCISIRLAAQWAECGIPYHVVRAFDRHSVLIRLY